MVLVRPSARFRLPAIVAAAFLAFAGSSGAQVIVDPGRLEGLKAPHPQATLSAGNGVYILHLATTGSSCGAWTATTGALHAAGAGRNVLYGGGMPATSDTILRSWSSGLSYRTGSEGTGSCTPICEVDAGSVQTIFTGPLQTGFRTTWTIPDGGSTIEFTQEINVDGPVDGTQTSENTVIRETHVVRNLGPGLLRFGLRKHWDWQISDDDGPWYATCDHVQAACDRSLEFHADGSGDGVYTPNYVMNEDPSDSLCPPGVTPIASGGCTGSPSYIVAGTVAPPSILVPPPDPPEILQFNSWPRLVNSCWLPTLDDYARCGALQTFNRDDTAIAYFYGATSGTAISLAPGDERSLTQYVVAAQSQCPSIVEPPHLDCDAGGPYFHECTGALATVALDGTGTSEDGTPTLLWTTTCPGGTFDDPTLADPVLSVDFAGCNLQCMATLTVTAASGDTSSCTANVQIVDTTAPVLSCPIPLTVECRGNGVRRVDADVSGWLASATATDACSGASVSDDMPAFVPLATCTTTRFVTFSAVDACGNVATCTRPLLLVDTQAPTLSCPLDRVIDCGSPSLPAEKQAWLAAAHAADSCAGPMPVDAPVLISAVPGCGGQVETYRWNIVDACGNATSCESHWLEADVTAPALAGVPAGGTVECPGPAAPVVTATDACDAAPHVEVSEQTLPGGCAAAYQVLRTWTAIDACGNSSTASQSLTVVDTTPPSLTAAPGDATVECTAIPTAATLTATDACDPSVPVVFSQTSAPAPCPAVARITRTWTATDDCSNVATRQQVLTVVDTTAPSLGAAPPDATVECTAIPAAATLTATDACDPSVPVVFSQSTASAPCPAVQRITRTWTATDDCGNVATRQQILTVVDTTAPSLAAAPADATVECTAIPAAATLTATDACDPSVPVVFSQSTASAPCPAVQRITRTWTATDDCGNVATRQQILTVVDTTAPSLTAAPGDTTVECTSIPAAATLTASDFCDPSVPVVFSESTGPGSCTQASVITRTWTATDDCGNVATRQQHVTVVDTTAPVLTAAPGDTTVECTSIPAAATLTASDLCDPSVPVVFSESTGPGSCPQASVITRTWTATDDCGNVATRQQHVTVVDTTAPVLTAAPGDTTVECTSIPAAATLTATDLCDPSVPVIFSESTAPGPCPQASVITRTWTATDDCGNVATRQQRITVVDTTAPVLTAAPGDTTVECTSIPAAATLTATDLCDPSVPVVFSESTGPGSCPQASVITRTWTATDDCGNVATRQQHVTVVDTTAPVLTAAPGDAIVECSAIPAAATLTATDACDPSVPVVFGESTAPGPCLQASFITRTWTATDDCGNAATRRQVLTVVDTTAPVLAGVPADATVECDAVPGPASPTASDLCDTAPRVAFVETSAPGRCPNERTLTRVWTATDACGNASTGTQVVSVVDTEAPEVFPPADLVVECPAPSSGVQSEGAWSSSATASDTCGPATPMSRLLSRVAGCGGTYVATWEFWAEDPCGNVSATQRRTYTVVDTTLPVLLPPADVVLECPVPGSGPGSEDEWLLTASATDTCGPARVEHELVESEPGCGGTFRHAFDFWAVDPCGNMSARVRRSFEVVDTTPPVFGSGSGDQFRTSIWPPNHGYVVYATADVVTASDACGTVTVRATGCHSSQPEEVHQGRTDDGGNGDGRTVEDCVVSVDGAQFAVRAERLGSCGADSMRVYSVAFTATDACGNETPGVGSVVVEHDRSGHQDVRRGRKLGPNDPPPFPYLHPTTYGGGCDGSPPAAPRP